MLLRVLVVFVGAICTAVASVVYPYLGVLVLAILTFGRPQDDRPNLVALHIPLMMTVAVLVGTMLRVGSVVPQLLSALKRFWIVFILLGLMAVSALNNWTVLSSGRLDDFATLILVCVLALTWVTSEKRLRTYMLTLLACGSYVAYQVIRRPENIVERIGGEKYERAAIAKGGTMFGNSNYLALFMVMTIFLAIPLLGYYRKWWQRFGLIAVIGSAGYVFFRANSRGASIALAVGMIVIWAMQKKKLKSAILGLVLIAVAAAFAPQSYWDRLGTISHYENDQSATGRLELWQIAVDLIAEHPVLGVGPDNFVLYAPNTPHDAYLQMACEVGIPAACVYVGILFVGLFSAFRARSLSSENDYIYHASQGVLCCILAITVQGFTTGLAHREVVYGFVALAVMLRYLALKNNVLSDEVAGIAVPQHRQVLESSRSEVPWNT